MNKTCSIDGCGRRIYGRGWCRNHYMRWWSRGGDPAVQLPARGGIKRGDENPMRRPEVAAKLTGENHGRWKGDAIGYGPMHERVRRALTGAPCMLADETCRGPIHSALIHGRGIKQEMRNGKLCWYSTRIEDYVPLCDSHHVRYDQHGSVLLEVAS